MRVSAALAGIAAIGPFFRLATDVDDSWRPFATLLDEPGLRERIGFVRSYLAEQAGCPTEEVEPRSAASVHLLGTVARLLSAPLAMSARHGVAPALTPATLWWRPGAPGAVEFATTTESTTDLQQVLSHVVAPFADRVGDLDRVSPKVLRGNVVSALAGAATVLRDPRADDEVRRLLGEGWLAGAGTWPEGGAFRRRNCCLLYRVPAAGSCGDCVLGQRTITESAAPRPGRSPAPRSARATPARPPR